MKASACWRFFEDTLESKSRVESYRLTSLAMRAFMPPKLPSARSKRAATKLSGSSQTPVVTRQNSRSSNHDRPAARTHHLRRGWHVALRDRSRSTLSAPRERVAAHAERAGNLARIASFTFEIRHRLESTRCRARTTHAGRSASVAPVDMAQRLGIACAECAD